jgi:hypothetical protein
MTRKAGFFIFSLLLLQGVQQVFSQGNLLVAPIRVVFEGAKQREDLNLSNIGQDTAVYLISFIHYQMLENGSFRQLENTDSLPTPRSDSYLRIFPRRVTLPPGESQVVRLQFRKPAGMSDGEYRSHLYFRAEKEVTPLGMRTAGADSSNLSVSITPIFGISIPVIIRSGNLNLDIKLSDVSLAVLNDSVYNLGVVINRTGNRSAYGNLRAEFVPDKGTSFEVGLANGVGVYTELNKRIYNLPLRIKNGAKLKGGKLVITFTSPADDGSKELAKTEYRLP